jgi:hypothetical protein
MMTPREVAFWYRQVLGYPYRLALPADEPEDRDPADTTDDDRLKGTTTP